MTPSTEIALVVPASNTVMEADIHRAAGARATVNTWRIALESVTREAEVRMLQNELPACLKEVAATQPDVVVFGCTSAGSLGGLEHDSELCQRLEAATGATAITVIGATLERLRSLGPRRTAVFTPYAPELTSSVTECIEEAGFEVVASAGMGLVDNLAIGRVRPESIVDFVSEQMTAQTADCIFLSCTNWQAIRAIEPLEDLLKTTVTSSNQAVIESLSRRADLNGSAAGQHGQASSIAKRS